MISPLTAAPPNIAYAIVSFFAGVSRYSMTQYLSGAGRPRSANDVMATPGRSLAVSIPS